MKPIVILGSGLAGYTLVRELRKLDRDVAITLVSRDSADFYSKPMLSNAFALGKNATTLINTAAADMSKQLNFTLLPNTEVLSIDLPNKQLQTTAGTIEYGRLVLALGADPTRLPLKGDAADSVMSVNDLADYARFRDALGSAKHITIIGGGLIGCEFANDLVNAGYSVTVIDPTAYPLSGLLPGSMPAQAGKQVQASLAGLGVTWRFGAAVQAVNKSPTGYTLSLSDASTLQTDLVLSAVGLRPRIALARTAGLAVNRGIVVDGQLRSSDTDIFALGDCAEIEGRVLSFVMPIMHAARALARLLVGESTRVEFPPMPVVVKTPAHPVVVLPVAHDAVGEWKLLAEGQGVKLGFFDAQNQLRGFVLSGEFVGLRSEMVKQVSTG